MSYFRDLKIIQKLLVLIGVCVFFIGIVGFAGFYFINILTGSLDSMYKEDLLSVQHLIEIRSDLNQLQADLLEMSTCNNKKTVQMLTKSDNKLLSEIDYLSSEFSKIKMDSYEKASMSKFNDMLSSKIKPDYQRIAMLSGEGKYKDAHSIIINNMAKFDEAAEIANQLAEHNVKAAKDSDSQNRQDSVIAITVIILAIVLAVLAALSIGLFIANVISGSISKVVGNLKEIADGNLKVNNIENDSKDETGVLSRALNLTVERLRALVGEVSKSVEDISASTEEMTAATEQTAQGSQQVSKSVEQLAAGAQHIAQNVSQLATGSQQIARKIAELAVGAQDQTKSVTQSLESINDINEAVQKIFSGAENTVNISKSTEDIAKNGNVQAEKAISKINQLEVTQSEISHTINQLGELSTNIELIVDLIKNIAGQTNLLALNAAIEAARAGEHGKGFAVVADEVKKLANQSAQATEKITAMIKEIQRMTQVAVSTMDNGIKEVKESVEIVDKVGHSLEEILEASQNTSKHIQEISNEVENLSQNSSKVTAMMENISSITQQTASNTEEISSITEETAASAEEISSITEETAASAEEISSVTEETASSLEEISRSSQILATVAEKLTRQIAVFKI